MCNINFGIFNILAATFLLVKAQYSITPSSSYALKNTEFHLTCNIGPSSTVPAFAINWRRNGVIVVFFQSSNCQTYEGSGGQELYQRYTYNCTSNRSYNLYISATQINNEDGSVWRCEDNDPRFGSSSDYSLIVYDPPTADPVISGYSGTTTYLGDTIALACSLDGGNPLATLTWTCKGVTVQGVNANTQTSAISRYTVTIDTSYNGQRCTCKTSHQLWPDDRVVQSQPFVVHYPPSENPVISGYDGSFRYKDDKVTLTCTVSGGSPQATLSWTCNGQQQIPISQSTSGTLVASKVTVTMIKEINGKTCICHGRHSDIRYSPNITSRSFIVYYPPSYPLVEVSLDTPFPWIEGGNGKLRCSVNDGNPPVSYEWLDPTGVISGQMSIILPLSSLTKDDNRRGYRCKVSNAYTIAKNMNLISQLKLLDVEYTPIISLDKTPVVVSEGQSVSRTCSAIGNPTPTVNWYRDNRPYTSSTGTSATLIIQTVKRNDTGTYTCKTAPTGKQRNIFTNVEDLQIYVYYLSINKPTPVCSSSESISISCCSVINSSRPLKFHGWTHRIGNTNIRSFDGKLVSTYNNSLSIDYCGYYDSGIYTCEASVDINNNNTWQYFNSSIEIIVPAPPVVSSNFIKDKVVNNKKIMSVQFYSVPKPVIVEWIKDGEKLTFSNKYQQITSVTNVTLLFYATSVYVQGYESSLSILNPVDTDFGSYTFRVQNSEGSAQIKLQLNKDDNHQGNMIGAVVGGVMAFIVTISITTIVICILRRRRINQNSCSENQVVSKAANPECSTDSSKEDRSYQDIEIKMYETLDSPCTTPNQYETLSNQQSTEN